MFEYTSNSVKINKVIETCGIPDGCEWVTKKQTLIADQIFVCSKYYNNFNITKCDLALKNYMHIDLMVFTLLIDEKSKRSVLNNSFQFYKFVDIINPAFSARIKLVNLKGFDANMALELTNQAAIEFYDINFDFYTRDNKIIRTCEEYTNSLDKWQHKKFIFNANSSNRSSSLIEHFKVCLVNSQFRTAVCPLVFEDTRLGGLYINNLVNSYYKKNVIKFIKVNRSINCTIKSYELESFYGLDLNKELINEIFEKTSEFLFDGVINSIQPDLFKSFKNLKSLDFNPICFLEIVRKQGIGWINNINYHVKVNLSDIKSVKNS